MPQQNEIDLQAALSNRLFSVPDYQRPYAWETKQLADLWEDLDLLGPSGAHYAGTLVLRDIPADGENVVTSVDEAGRTLVHSEVVDGQQRLTTCLLLLDRVRRKLESLDSQGAAGAGAIARRIAAEFGHVTIDGAEQPRLTLGTELKTFWEENVLGSHPFTDGQLLPGQRRLRAAVEFFDDRISGLTAEVPESIAVDRLRELQRRVTAGLRFLVYQVSSAAEVGVIFETLNERGRPLSDLEKTKNYLLYLARQIGPAGQREKLVDLINEKWSGIFKNLSGAALGMEDQLLRGHWLATVNPDPRSWQGIASVKGRFDRARYVPGTARLKPTEDRGDVSWDKLFEEVAGYVHSLHDCASYLAESLNPDGENAFLNFGEGAAEARSKSAALLRSGVVAIYRPLLFASRLSRPEDGSFYAALVDLCERYSARVFVIGQRRANAGQTRLFRLAHELYNGASPDEVLSEIRTVLWRYADDESLRQMFDSVGANWYARRGHKYFLYEYELHLTSGGEAPPPLSYFTSKLQEQRTTEHILPQKPKDDAHCWWDVFSEEQHAKLRHSLGNLVLTYDNSVYSNKCFDLKRGSTSQDQPCYATATLAQERELAYFDQWSPAEIASRQRMLAEWALQRWHVEAPETEQLENQEVEPEIEPEGSEDEVALAEESFAEAQIADDRRVV